MEVPQGIDDNGVSVHHNYVAEASASWAADLKNAEIAAILNGLRIVMIAPRLHTPLQSSRVISKTEQALGYEFRRAPFGTNRQDWRALGKLLDEVVLYAGDYGIDHVVQT